MSPPPQPCPQTTVTRDPKKRRDGAEKGFWLSLVVDQPQGCCHLTSCVSPGSRWGHFPQPHHSPDQAFSLTKEPLLPFPSLLPLGGLGGSGPGQNNVAGPRLRAAPSLSQPFAKWEIRGRVTYFLCSQGASVPAKQGGEDSAALPGLHVPVGCCGDRGGR